MEKYNITKLNNDTFNYVDSLSVAEIVEILEELSDNYYNTKTPLVSDDAYDTIREILEEKDNDNDYLKKVGAPVINKEAVDLPFYMPSLNKIKPDTNLLDKYLEKYKGPYVISDKLDGVSGLYYYCNGKENMYTRGDIEHGQDITHLIKYVFSKKLVLGNITEIAIRGELIISKKNFKILEGEFKNARNTVAGLVNSKRFSKKVAKLTEFIGYSVLYPELTQQDQMKLLEKINCSTVTHNIKKNIDNDYLSNYIVERRKDSPYEIDGLVIIDSSKIYGNMNKNPDYGFAFKKVLTDQIAEASIRDIEWTVSKHGYIKPRVKIEPIKLKGVVITYATAHNAKFVFDNKLGPGAIVTLIRSGDVIPKIENVIKPAVEPKMPSIPFVWNKTKVDVVASNITDDTRDNIKIKKLTDFFRILKVKNISEGIVTKLVNEGYDNIVSIITTTTDELSQIDGLGEKIINKIKADFEEKIQTTNLYTLMAASNVFGRGFGVRRSKLIINTYPDIMTKKWSNDKLKSEIMNIPGFDDITASQFVANFNEFKNFFNVLSQVVDLSHINNIGGVNNQNKTDLLKDEIIVFTGVRDKLTEEFIENNGGKISTSLSSKTTMLIYLDETSSGAKLKKAIQLKIKTMPLIDFKIKYGIK